MIRDGDSLLETSWVLAFDEAKTELFSDFSPLCSATSSINFNYVLLFLQINH